ncbi:MAG: VOC family protein [Candidatus Omnitrophica bacterium]|nr:VOC family protein [Candidatus Omnitrophota bacterium]MCK5179522.1 VOC family protein [Candidatus Omnitrophota bacterium]
MNVHHFGLATKNMEKSMEAFRTLGFEVGDIIVDPLQKVKVAFVTPPSGSLIELVCDLDENGPVGKIVGKVGSSFYHMCFEADDLEATIEGLRNKKYLLRHKPIEAVAFNGRRIAWMYNRSIGLVELLEKEKGRG